MKRRVWMISLLALFLTACGNSGNSEDSIQGNFMEDSAQEIPVEDNLQATTFTMEELMTLWSDDNYIEAIEEEGIGFFLQYENFELVQDEDASTWIYEALLPYGDRTYQLRVEHNWPHQFEQSFPNDNPVERIVLREMEFGDEITLYSRSDKEYEKLNITGFLAKEYHDITYYLDFDLPEGVALGEHKLYTCRRSGVVGLRCGRTKGPGGRLAGLRRGSAGPGPAGAGAVAGSGAYCRRRFGHGRSIPGGSPGWACPGSFRDHAGANDRRGVPDLDDPADPREKPMAALWRRSGCRAAGDEHLRPVGSGYSAGAADRSGADRPAAGKKGTFSSPRGNGLRPGAAGNGRRRPVPFPAAAGPDGGESCG